MKGIHRFACHHLTTTTRYNAAGQPLSSVQKQLISELSPTLESKSVFVSERGLTSTQWSEYSEDTKRIQYSAVPTSDITAEAVTVDGNVTLHQRYIYRGYLQIACIDLTRSHHPALWYITWDPTQPVATRPLAIQKDATWYTYGWDLSKNMIGHGIKIDGKDYVEMKDGRICVNNMNIKGKICKGFGCNIENNPSIVSQSGALNQLTNELKALALSNRCTGTRACVFSGPVDTSI